MYGEAINEHVTRWKWKKNQIQWRMEPIDEESEKKNQATKREEVVLLHREWGDSCEKIARFYGCKCVVLRVTCEVITN